MRSVSVLLFAIPSVVAAQQFVDVLIEANDDAYLNPPTSLGPGLTAFSFENTGCGRHEMILLRLKRGITVDSAGRVPNAGGPPQPLDSCERLAKCHSPSEASAGNR